MSAKKEAAVPAAVGRAVTEYAAARRKLATAQARLKPLEDEAARRGEALMDLLDRHRLTSARVGSVGVSLGKPIVPTIEDWDRFVTFVVKTRGYDLLQRRVSAEAWRERLEAKVVVPGVKGFARRTLTLR